MALQKIMVPDIGGYTDVHVIEINIQVGDTVRKEESLITLETDKASMEIPAPISGKVIKIEVVVGNTVSQGDIILLLESDDKLINNSKISQLNPISSSTQNEQISIESEVLTNRELVNNDKKIKASPIVRRLARLLNINLAHITATGRKGCITQNDCHTYIKQLIKKASSNSSSNKNTLELLPDPKINFAVFGNIKSESLSRINKISSRNLSRNWIKIPHVTFHDNADISELEKFRKSKKDDAKQSGIKLTLLSFLIKSITKVLSIFPRINSSLSDDGENLILKQYFNIGFATDTPKGLIVPVIKNADQKGIYQISSEIMLLAKKAREGNLKSEEIEGSTFTISSLGILGTTSFTPIINMPEVAILGVSKAEIKPVWNGKNFIPRTLLPLSLSTDHRVIDGAMASKFLTKYSKILSDIREILL